MIVVTGPGTVGQNIPPTNQCAPLVPFLEICWVTVAMATAGRTVRGSVAPPLCSVWWQLNVLWSNWVVDRMRCVPQGVTQCEKQSRWQSPRGCPKHGATFRPGVNHFTVLPFLTVLKLGGRRKTVWRCSLSARHESHKFQKSMLSEGAMLVTLTILSLCMSPSPGTHQMECTFTKCKVKCVGATPNRINPGQCF